MSRELRSAEEIANYLARLYREKFGGKEFGKFKFPYKAALTIFDREAIRQSLLNEINDYLCTIEGGFKLVQFGDGFAMFSVKYLNGLRPLPKKAWEQFADAENIKSTK
ncbi:MAG TPA: hypothetical protein ENJ21_01115 [Chromatiaceae bacterium]|nr:hypothetical protein [Chromatiaceae bacterium]